MREKCQAEQEMDDDRFSEYIPRKERCEACGNRAQEDYHLCRECEEDARQYQRDHDAYYYN